MRPPALALTLTDDVLPAEIDGPHSALEHEGDGRDQLHTFEVDLQRVGAQSTPRPQPGAKSPHSRGAALHLGLPLPWGAPRAAAPQWALACGLRRHFSNPRPPRAARPRHQPPGRSAEPSREPAAGGLAVTAGAQASSHGLLGKPRLSPFSAAPGAPRSCPPPSPRSSGCLCSAGSLGGHSIARAHLRCSPRASLGRAKPKGRHSRVHTPPERGNPTPAACRAWPLSPHSLLPSSPYPIGQQQASAATWRREKSCSSSAADPTPAAGTSPCERNTGENSNWLLRSRSARKKSDFGALRANCPVPKAQSQGSSLQAAHSSRTRTPLARTALLREG